MLPVRQVSAPAAGRLRLRAIVRTLHLWLGLATGAVVFVVAVTGCCWVFQDEIHRLSDGLPTVARANETPISPTEARRLAERELPGRHVHGVVYRRGTAPLEVIFWEEDPEFYQSVFLDPSSGRVMEVRDHLSGFFAFVLRGHLHLWLPEPIGKQVVAWSTLVFVLMLTSGLFLWWPRSKSHRRQKFRFAWKPGTGWKRKNYDLHSIAGMYVFAIALITAVTGLVMAFDWFESAVYTAVGGDKALTFAIPDSIATPGHGKTSVMSIPQRGPGEMAHVAGVDDRPIDRLPAWLEERHPRARSFEIHYPASDRASIYVEIAYEDGVYYSSDYRFYDQATLQELQAPSLYGVYADSDIPDKMIRMNYDTHVGAILGLPTKILMFVSSLIVASLPVTGALFWLGKRTRSTGRLRQRTDRKDGGLQACAE